MGNGSSFCPTGQAVGTNLLACIPSCFPYNLKFQQTDCPACYLLHAGLLLGLIFDTESGEDLFFRSVGCL
jgi:hypothetical protein